MEDIFISPRPDFEELTDYGKGYEPKVETKIETKQDNVKDIPLPYYTCDGKQVATLDEVMLYNELYYERLKLKNEINIDTPKMKI